MGEKYYIPSTDEACLEFDELRRWYANLLHEVRDAGHSCIELKRLSDKKNYYGKYFDEAQREFFLNHFARNLVETSNYILGMGELKPRVLEIGSGCGNQLLLLGLLGAQVTGCDIDKGVCELVEKRVSFYEKLSGRELDISLFCGDALNLSESSKFDAVHFLFSFSNIRPHEAMLNKVKDLLKPGGRLVLQETNQTNYYNRLFRRRDELKPREVARWLKKHGFRVHSLKGGWAIPPLMWRFLPRTALEPIEQVLCRSLFLSPSYHLMAEKL